MGTLCCIVVLVTVWDIPVAAVATNVVAVAVTVVSVVSWPIVTVAVAVSCLLTGTITAGRMIKSLYHTITHVTYNQVFFTKTVIDIITRAKLSEHIYRTPNHKMCMYDNR